jgi:hypothetical protein
VAKTGKTSLLQEKSRFKVIAGKDDTSQNDRSYLPSFRGVDCRARRNIAVDNSD